MKKIILLSLLACILSEVNAQNYLYAMVGRSSYGCQSLGSMRRNIISYGDSSVSFVWNTADSAETSDFVSRGSGYNYRENGTYLVEVMSNYHRIEKPQSVRTGFGSLAILPNNKELIVAQTDKDGFAFSTATKGSNIWTTVVKPEATRTIANTKAPHPKYAKVATGGVDGNTIHLIACYDTSTTTALESGVIRPIVYSRSIDGGNTWDKVSIELPGCDTTLFRYGVPDNYSIDASAEHVAILIGSMGTSLVLWKSDDNGSTFTKTTIRSVSLNMEASNDTILSNDGTASVVVDKNGKAHVAYTAVRVAGNGIADGAFKIFSDDMNLFYWNEITQKSNAVIFRNADIAGDPFQPFVVGPNSYNAPTTPSIALDDDKQIVYIAFSLPTHDDINANGKSYRDAWITSSCSSQSYYDANMTFTSWNNFTATYGINEMYVALAKNTSDGYLHTSFQVNLQPELLVDGAMNLQPARYETYYRRIPKHALDTMECLSGMTTIHNLGDLRKSAIVYPNPFNTQTAINFDLQQKGPYSLTVYNVLGERVLTRNNVGDIGANSIQINKSELNIAGVYFYDLIIGNQVYKGKIVLE